MADEQSGEEGTLVTEKDAGEGNQGLLKFWLMELHSADKLEKDFRENGTAIEERYEAEEAEIKENSGSKGLISHNILYSNVETMRPALYDSTPVPDIRRRFRDQDPVGKQVSEMLERASAHQLEINDMDSIMDDVILDSLLPSRGAARLSYEPTFQTIPEQQSPFDPPIVDEATGLEEFQTEPEREIIKDEKVKIIYVPWRNLRISPARTWADVRWISFDWYLRKEQLQKMFPGKNVPLDTQTEESHNKEQEFDKVPSVFKRAYVREIWDKKTRQVIFVAPSFKEGPLRIDEDPLRLEGFFPMPKPLYGLRSRKSMIPIPEFKQYASQALELDMITKRIQGLIKALRLRGVYDAALTEMSQIQELADNEYIPVENANQWRDKGGLANAIFTMPIVEASKVLLQLYQQRDQIKDTIFEITGLSDIIRGVSDPNETLGAQNIKSQFGSLRINRRQREVQRYSRDIIRLMVEIIAEHFQPQTLTAITQKEVTPDMMQVMKSDQLRSYRIDIETDSTIARQLQDEEENYTKLLTAISQFVMGIAPMVAQGFFPIEVAVSLLQSGIRRFKMGRSVEDAFEQIDIEQAKASLQQQQQQGQSDPDAEAKAQELQIKTEEIKQKLQLEAQKLQLKQQEQQADIQMEQQKLQSNMQIEQQKLQLEREKAGAELTLKRDVEGQKIEASQKPTTTVQFDTKGEMDETFGQVIQAMNQITQSNSETMQQVAALMAQATQQIAVAVQELAKPKKLIKDKNGRPIGSESVDEL